MEPQSVNSNDVFVTTRATKTKINKELEEIQPPSNSPQISDKTLSDNSQEIMIKLTPQPPIDVAQEPPKDSNESHQKFGLPPQKIIFPQNALPSITHTIPLNSFNSIPMGNRQNNKLKDQRMNSTNMRKNRTNRSMRLAMGMEPYDILNNLDKIQPQITLRQLLAIAPKCRGELSSSLIRKRARTVDVNDISLDPGAPTIEVMIDGSLIYGVQIDSGSSVNLMNHDTMEELGLTNMTPTPIILRMADQSRVKPLGLLSQIPTIVGGIEYKVDYIIFKITESISSYPILLGRPWLYLAKAKDDWGKGTLTIGKGKNKIVLPMYPPIYHGETQEEDSDVTSQDSYGSDYESDRDEIIKHVTKEVLPLLNV